MWHPEKADRNVDLASTERKTTNLRKAGPGNVSQTSLEARMRSSYSWGSARARVGALVCSQVDEPQF